MSKSRKRLGVTFAALLAAALTPLATVNANAMPLPDTPLTVSDTGGNYVAIYPFGGQPQTQFAPIGPGQLNFTLDVTGVPDSSLDDNAFFSVRMDVGSQGNDVHNVNIVGPVTDGTDNEGLLLGGTLSLFTITQWSYATDGTPISLSYFNILDDGVQGTLSVDFVSATPLPTTWTMMMLGLAGLGFFAFRGTKNRSGVASA